MANRAIRGIEYLIRVYNRWGLVYEGKTSTSMMRPKDGDGTSQRWRTTTSKVIVSYIASVVFVDNFQE